MKKRVKRTTEALIIFASVFVLLIAPIIGDTYQSYYTQYGEVYLTDDSETLIVDATGNIWSVGNNAYHKGETVKMKFFTNHTDYTREDDEIISVKRVD